MRAHPPFARTIAAAVASAAVVAALVFTAGAASATPVYPTKMAALGDSITQAATTCSSLTSCPANSWSTGTTTSVASHASRLRLAGDTGLVAYNDAVSGATSAALPGQAATAVSQGAQYVTIEMGANDACTSSVSTMTSTATFQTNVTAALTTLKNAGTAHIFVASIPSLTRLYNLEKGSFSARFIWAILGVCKSMLANPTSTSAADVARRVAVQQRVDDFNAILAAACTATTNCTWDGNAVANYAFVKSDIGTTDYFHPSLSGQATIARITWAASPWGP
jgi:lysophospholipase L1-like esterase